MRYPNALNGIKKVYTAQILMLVAGLLTGVASFFGSQASKEMAEGGITAASAFGVMIPLFAGGILAVAAGLFELFGLKTAAQDDEYFKKGYTYSLISLVISIVISVLSFMNIGGKMLTDLGSTVSDFIQTVVTFYVIYGVRNLAEKLGDSEMAERGTKVFWVYAAAIILASLVELAMGILQNTARTLVVGIFGAVMLVLMAVGYIMYLRYLSSAKKMLA